VKGEQKERYKKKENERWGRSRDLRFSCPIHVHTKIKVLWGVEPCSLVNKYHMEESGSSVFKVEDVGGRFNVDFFTNYTALQTRRS
jgi:hypothetical protein